MASRGAGCLPSDKPNQRDERDDHVPVMPFTNEPVPGALGGRQSKHDTTQGPFLREHKKPLHFQIPVHEQHSVLKKDALTFLQDLLYCASLTEGGHIQWVMQPRS